MDRPPQPTRLGTDVVALNRADVLTKVLAEHAWTKPRGYAGYVCSCGSEFDEGDDGQAVRIHVAAALDAALAAQEGKRGHREGCQRFPTGYLCVADCPTVWQPDAQEGERGGAEVAARERDAKVLMDFAQWVSTHRAHNGSNHRHGQSLYNECINGVLPVWASEWLDER